MNQFDDAMFYCAGVQPFDLKESRRPFPQVPELREIEPQPERVVVDSEGYPCIPIAEWFVLDHRMREEVARRRSMQTHWEDAEIRAQRWKYGCYATVFACAVLFAIWMFS